ncbi:unnamed protein product [Choristocarpus tenellus]
MRARRRCSYFHSSWMSCTGHIWRTLKIYVTAPLLILEKENVRYFSPSIHPSFPCWTVRTGCQLSRCRGVASCRYCPTSGSHHRQQGGLARCFIYLSGAIVSHQVFSLFGGPNILVS